MRNTEIIPATASRFINIRRKVNFNINRYDSFSYINYIRTGTLTIVPGEPVWSCATRITQDGNHVIENGSWHLEPSLSSKCCMYTPMSYDEFNNWNEVILSFCANNFPGVFNRNRLEMEWLTDNSLYFGEQIFYTSPSSNKIALSIAGSCYDMNKDKYDTAKDKNYQAMIIFGDNSIPRIIIGTGVSLKKPKESCCHTYGWWYAFYSKYANSPMGSPVSSNAYFFLDNNPVPGTPSAECDFNGIFVLPLTEYNLRRLFLELCGNAPSECLTRDELHIMYTV